MTETHLWTWGGACFGYRDGGDLWAHDGRLVGRFHGDEVYGPDGRYLGEIRDGDRLVTRTSGSFPLKGMFGVRLRGARGVRGARGARGMVGGLGDFPRAEDLR